MKYTFIALLIIIIGGIIWYSQEPAQTPAPAPAAQTETQAPQNSDDMMMDRSMMDTEGETVPGNDVGMEYPDMDMSISSDATLGTTGNVKTFNITGTNFAYDVPEMRVQQGDSVMIHFMSGGGMHDWVIDEFGVRTKLIQPGDMDMVTFVANKKGTFEYYCSVGSHRENGMVGKLIVE